MFVTTDFVLNQQHQIDIGIVQVLEDLSMFAY